MMGCIGGLRDTEMSFFLNLKLHVFSFLLKVHKFFEKYQFLYFQQSIVNSYYVRVVRVYKMEYANRYLM